MWENIKLWFSDKGSNVFFKSLIIAVVGILIIHIVMKLLNSVLERGRMDKSAHNLIKTITRSVMWILLALVVVASLGVDVSGIVAVASVASLAVSLALQNLFGNVVGGFTLLYTHPFKAGDYVEIAALSGTVKDIGIAYTRLITPDNKIVSIPNNEVVAKEIVNYTAMGKRRLEISVSASYDAPLRQVESALTEAARVEGVMDDPAPFVSVSSYGDSAINYVIRVWTKCEDYWNVHFAITHKIKDVFDEQNISMTYPHLNVHLEKSDIGTE